MWVSGKIPVVKDDSNRYFKGFTIDVPHSGIIRIETLSRLYPFFEFKFLIIRRILSSFVSTLLIRFSVLWEKLANVLEFATREHCETKKLLKRLAFVVKSGTKEPFTTNDGILGVFLPKSCYGFL